MRQCILTFNSRSTIWKKGRTEEVRKKKKKTFIFNFRIFKSRSTRTNTKHVTKWEIQGSLGIIPIDLVLPYQSLWYPILVTDFTIPNNLLLFFFFSFFSGGENPLPVFPGELVSPYFWYFVWGRLIKAQAAARVWATGHFGWRLHRPWRKRGPDPPAAIV